MTEYDESTNPSNGWQVPEVGEPDENYVDEALQDLQPGSDENPYDAPKLQYNPLNHAYPMIAETEVGVIEVMVQFALVRGRDNLPGDMSVAANALCVPVSIEDLPVSDFSLTSDPDLPVSKPEDVVSQGALMEEIFNGGRFYLVPTIVRGRRLSSGEIGSTDSWEPLTKEEVSAIISGPALLDLIVGYADKVGKDPDAPAGLLDLLDHFTGRYKNNGGLDPDEEWNDEEGSDYTDDGHDPSEERRWDWTN